VLEGLTHSTCDRNVVSEPEDVRIKSKVTDGLYRPGLEMLLEKTVMQERGEKATKR